MINNSRTVVQCHFVYYFKNKYSEKWLIKTWVCCISVYGNIALSRVLHHCVEAPSPFFWCLTNTFSERPYDGLPYEGRMVLPKQGPFIFTANNYVELGNLYAIHHGYKRITIYI